MPQNGANTARWIGTAAAAAVAAPLLQANPPVAANWGRSTASTAAAAAVTAMTNIQSQSVLEER